MGCMRLDSYKYRHVDVQECLVMGKTEQKLMVKQTQ